MRANSSIRLGILRGALFAAPRLRRIAAGYSAKVACSAVFLSGRSIADVLREDLEAVPGVRLELDREKAQVHAQIRGCRRTAAFTEGLGAVLLHESEDLALPGLDPRPEATPTDSPWPQGDGAPTGLAPESQAKLDAVLDDAFSEPDPKRPRRTRAVVVVHRGQLIAERYAPGFDASTRLLGWSMTKSIVNALVGLLVAEGKLDVHQPVAAPEWSAPNDPRASLSYDVLLRMSSGLKFWEQYWNPLSHVSSMLFHYSAAAAYAGSFPLVAEPDTRWSYASGTTNVVARALRGVIGGDHASYLSYPQRALFDRIGMRSAQVELDASGHFVGSSFSYATARDWARFGQLYLQDGVWEGERLLPAGWVDYTRSPAPAAPLGDYGAHFWLNTVPARGGASVYPSLPHDAFFARGHEEQSVSIIPSRDAVIVRLGQTADREAWSIEHFVGGVLSALP